MNGDAELGYLVDPGDLERFEDEGAEGGIAHQLAGDILENRGDAIGVLTVRDRDVRDEIGVVLGQIDHRGDLAEGGRVHPAGVVAQADGADRDGLDDAGVTLADIDDVADSQRVLDQHEEAGDDVLDQRLAAEADGETDDPRPGEERRDVDADLGEDDERDEEKDDDEHRRAQQREQGAGAGAAGHQDAVAVDRVEVALDRRAEDLPDGEGDQNHGTDTDQYADQAATKIGVEPGEGGYVPRLQNGKKGECIDQRRHHHGEDRQIAVGTLLQRREF